MTIADPNARTNALTNARPNSGSITGPTAHQATAVAIGHAVRQESPSCRGRHDLPDAPLSKLRLEDFRGFGLHLRDGRAHCSTKP